MLESILAGTPVAIGFAAWAAYGPALVLFVLAVIALMIPQSRRPTLDRRPTHVVTRATDEPSNFAYLPGIVLVLLAAGLLYWGGRPQVVIASDGLTCRPFTRTLAMSEIRAVRYAAVGEPSRPVVELDLALAGPMRRGGVPTRIEEVVVGAMRGRNAIGARGATCPLGGLARDGREVADLIVLAWARAALGALPAPDDDAAIAAYCTATPGRLGANCAATLRRGAQDCAGESGAAAILACRYRAAAGVDLRSSAAPPPAPRPQAPVPAPSPAPGPAPAPPPATPAPVPPPAPATTPPASPPGTPPSPPATRPTPPPTPAPPAAPTGKPVAPAPTTGKPGG